MTKLDKDPSCDTALQEISFWLKLERTLLKIQEKRESVEVVLTLDILKHRKMFHAPVAFDMDTGLSMAMATVKDYNRLMYFFPVNDLLLATEMDSISKAVQGIFVHLRKIRNTKYPIQRALRLVEAISRDVSSQLLNVLGNRHPMDFPYEEFEKVMTQCQEVFNTWDIEYDKLQRFLGDIVKKKRYEDLMMGWRVNFSHKRVQERMQQIVKFRQQHEQLRTVLVRVLRPTLAQQVSQTYQMKIQQEVKPEALTLEPAVADAIEEVDLAFETLKEVDTFEMTKEGGEAWAAAMTRYDVMIERVKSRLTARLRDQLGNANYASGSMVWAKQIDRRLMMRIEDGLDKGRANHVECQKLRADGDSFRINQKESRKLGLRNQKLQHTLLQQSKMDSECLATLDTLNLEAIKIKQQFEILQANLIELQVQFILQILVGISTFNALQDWIWPLARATGSVCCSDHTSLLCTSDTDNPMDPVMHSPHVMFCTQIDGNPGDDSDNSDTVSFANDSEDDVTFANDFSNSDGEAEDSDAGSDCLVPQFNNQLKNVFYRKVPSPAKKTFPEFDNPMTCSLSCNAKCSDVVASWSDSDVEDIRRIFVGSKSVALKTILLMHLKFQQSAGLPVSGFFFKNQLLCVKYFCAIAKISRYHVTTVLKDFARGCERYIHASLNQTRCSAACTTFVSWLTIFSERYGQNGPTDIVTVLPSYLNKAELYKIYILEAPKPHVKLSTFYKLFKTKFGPRRDNNSLPWIRISKVSTHSKCDTCLGLHQYQRKCKSSSELEFCNALKSEHLAKYKNARIAVGNFIHRSVTSPEQVISLQIDSMDNSKSIIPKILEKSKNLTLKYRLPSKITGCILTSSLYPENRRIKFYVNHGIYIYDLFKMCY